MKEDWTEVGMLEDGRPATDSSRAQLELTCYEQLPPTSLSNEKLTGGIIYTRKYINKKQLLKPKR